MNGYIQMQISTFIIWYFCTCINQESCFAMSPVRKVLLSAEGLILLTLKGLCQNTPAPCFHPVTCSLHIKREVTAHPASLSVSLQSPHSISELYVFLLSRVFLVSASNNDGNTGTFINRITLKSKILHPSNFSAWDKTEGVKQRMFYTHHVEMGF